MHCVLGQETTLKEGSQSDPTSAGASGAGELKEELPKELLQSLGIQDTSVILP